MAMSSILSNLGGFMGKTWSLFRVSVWVLRGKAGNKLVSQVALYWCGGSSEILWRNYPIVMDNFMDHFHAPT